MVAYAKPQQFDKHWFFASEIYILPLIRMQKGNIFIPSKKDEVYT